MTLQVHGTIIVMKNIHIEHNASLLALCFDVAMTYVYVKCTTNIVIYVWSYIATCLLCDSGINQVMATSRSKLGHACVSINVIMMEVKQLVVKTLIYEYHTRSNRPTAS